MDETLREAEQMTVRLLDDRVDEIRERNAHDAGQGLHNRRSLHNLLTNFPVESPASARERVETASRRFKFTRQTTLYR